MTKCQNRKKANYFLFIKNRRLKKSKYVRILEALTVIVIHKVTSTLNFETPLDPQSKTFCEKFPMHNSVAFKLIRDSEKLEGGGGGRGVGG